MATAKRFQGVGKRKTSVARLFMIPGEGKFTINGRSIEKYFGLENHRRLVHQPLEVTGNEEKFDISVNVHGGGVSSQAGAILHGLSKALLALNPDYRKPLNRNGFLTRDSRMVERKKYGKRKARKSTQFSKR